VKDSISAVVDLAETLLRGALEKIAFGRTFELKSELNDTILVSI